MSSIPVSVYAQTPWNPYTLDPAGKWRQWFQWRVSEIIGFSPWADPIPGWHPAAGAYLDLYSIQKDPSKNWMTMPPDWQLYDASGNPLYIPWGCANGTCPQYAADIRHPGYIAAWLGRVAQLRDLKYKILYVDDVNLDGQISDGNGTLVMPPGMTNDLWSAAVCDLLGKVRSQFPDLTIVHNPVWYSRSSYVQVEQQLADLIDVERGYGDPNLTPQTSVNLLRFVQGSKKPVLQMEYTKDNLAYKIACFLLGYRPGNRMAVLDLFPDAWDLAMDVDFGQPLEPPRDCSGNGRIVWNRDFSLVSVFVDFTAKTGTVTTL